MKKVGKPVFFIILLLIAAIGWLTVTGYTTWYGDISTRVIKGISDIRWGIDIRGGVDVTFAPPEGLEVTDAELAAAKDGIEVRMIKQNITDYEAYTDYDNRRIIVRFPWKADESDFDPEQAIAELGETANLTFRELVEQDPVTGAPAGTTLEAVVLEGKDVKSAQVVSYTDETTGGQHIAVNLELNESGRESFAEATGRLVGQQISIWMDDTLISAPEVQEQITDGMAQITGPNIQNADGYYGFTFEEADELARRINGGALPFPLETTSYNTISPTLGTGAKDAMVMAGAIAFVLVALIMMVMYRLPGVVAVIALAGQVILMIASITGFFSIIPSFTLTLPGIAGIILSIGFGVDANVITAERIKEELHNGRSIDGAIDAGFKRAFTAILDSNVTVIIVAVILMGAFGPPDSIFAKMLSWVFFMFGPSAAGSIYSFGYTLLVGVVLNLLMGVLASRLMLKSLSRQGALRNPVLYGGKKA